MQNDFKVGDRVVLNSDFIGSNKKVYAAKGTKGIVTGKMYTNVYPNTYKVLVGKLTLDINVLQLEKSN
jgi:hypothetical protein